MTRVGLKLNDWQKLAAVSFSGLLDGGTSAAASSAAPSRASPLTTLFGSRWTT